MFTFIAVLISCVIMAVAWRVRGGWLSVPSTQLGRLIPAVVLAAAILFFTGNVVVSLLSIPALWVGTIFPWAQWMDMGRVEENDDFVGMFGRGMILLAPLAILFSLFGITAYPEYMIIAGGMMSPIYWLSWKAPDFRLGSFIDGSTAIGELATGAWIMAVSAVFILLV